ncbi:MAG: hypothetical protein R3D61_04610 [Defluviimonas denitrificans]
MSGSRDADKRREVMAKIEKLMQDEGVIIQPYWRSLYRHFTDKVKGCDMHPTRTSPLQAVDDVLIHLYWGGALPPPTALP